jgi:hypothetical protein
MVATREAKSIGLSESGIAETLWIRLLYSSSRLPATVRIDAMSSRRAVTRMAFAPPYADDAVVHCRSHGQAEEVMRAIASRLEQCGLTMHPEKPKIVYCKDMNSTVAYQRMQFSFRAFTFRPRQGNEQVQPAIHQFPADGEQQCAETAEANGTELADTSSDSSHA